MTDSRAPYAYLFDCVTDQIDDAIELIEQTTSTAIDRDLLAERSPAWTNFLGPWPKSANASPTNLEELIELCERVMPELSGTSHVRRYAELGYVEMWLRLNYPAHFLAAGLSQDSRIPYFRASRLNVLSRANIRVLPPSLNRSHASATVIDGDVLLGLDAINALPTASIQFILQERATSGEFESLEDLDERAGVIDQGNGAFEHMVKSGALDCTGDSRASMLRRTEARYFGTGAAMSQRDSAEDLVGAVVVHEFESLGCSVTFDLLRSEPANTSRAGMSGVVWKVVDEPAPDDVPSRRVAMITSEGIGCAQFLGEAVERFEQLTAPFEFIRIAGTGFGWMGAPARNATAAYAPDNGLVRR
jgi:hypothetical protein